MWEKLQIKSKHLFFTLKIPYYDDLWIIDMGLRAFVKDSTAITM